MHDLKKIAAECISELKAIDIPIQDEKIREIVAVPLHKDGYKGHCVMTEDGGFRIEIWFEMLNDNVRLVSLKSLIEHELIHTCRECMEHDGVFRGRARKIDKHYGYKIMTGDDDSLHPENPVLDKLQCTKCKYVQLYRKRQNSNDIRMIKNIAENLLPRCPYCGGKTVHTKLQE